MIRRWQTPAIPDLPKLFSLIISQSVRFGGWDLIGERLFFLMKNFIDTR
jgi:hypothetical protein